MYEPSKAVRRGPIDGSEPSWVHDLPVDNLLGGMTALLAEVCILRDRVRSLERLLAEAGVVPDGAVDSRRSDDNERRDNEREIAAIVTRFWSEVGRGRDSWASAPPYVRSPTPGP